MSDGAEETQPGQGLVLGTAGHIDHGKTSLIRALTGVNTDRLPEEKARGITIELGFAALDLPDAGRISVVDVPGHEGLVRTMVSGASGIDLLLLVVAADESVMPQTREHVAICHLLGIERGVVALTKSDLADEELIELSREEVSELLAETHLADSPIVAVSAETGEGIDELKSALTEAVQKTPPRTTRSGPPRLPIDRIFAMRGFGTVVTGTLVGDSLKRGQNVEVHPSGIPTRIRGLQTHGDEAESVPPGVRCAVNLQNVDLEDLHRGDVVTLPQALLTTDRADVHLHWLSDAPARDGITAVELLTGTAERRARLAGIDQTGFQPGSAGFARLHIDGPRLALLPGDRFIVRGFSKTQGAGATLGGGIVLDAHPPPRRRSDPRLAEELDQLLAEDPEECVRVRVERTGFEGLEQKTLALEMGLSQGEAEERLHALKEQGALLKSGRDQWIDASVMTRLEAQLLSALEDFHAQQPMRPGMQKASVLASLPENVSTPVAEFALQRLVEAGKVESRSDVAWLASHEARLDPEAESAAKRMVEEARSAGLEATGTREWIESLGISNERFRDLAAHLERQGDLIRAPGDLWFDRRAIEKLRDQVIGYLEEHGEIDTSHYKTLIGTSRRTAMPLMELMDELHITRRQGDVRVLRPGASNLE